MQAHVDEQDQEPMSKAAPKAERGERHPHAQFLRPLPGGERERHECDGAVKWRVSLRHFWRIEGQRGSGSRGCRARSSKSRLRRASPSAARLRRDSSRLAPRQSRLRWQPDGATVQKGTGKRRHEERGKEENGDGLVELKIFQCDEIGRRRADHDSGANHLHGALRRV